MKATKAFKALMACPPLTPRRHPIRWYYERRPYKGHRKGLTKRKYYVPVMHGDARYENAPFEEAVMLFRHSA